MSKKEVLFEKNKSIRQKKEDRDDSDEVDDEDEELNISRNSQILKSELKDEIKVGVVAIKNEVDNLDHQFNKILDKHHNDYIVTFNEFMETVKKDIKVKIENIEKVEKERRKNENIKIIIAEREFFRSEAIRLNKICKGLN